MAMMSPTSSMSNNSSLVKVINFSNDFTFLAIFLAVVSPTCLMPMAYNTRSNGIFLLASMPSIKLLADFSAMRSNGNTCSFFKSYKSAIVFTKPALYN